MNNARTPKRSSENESPARRVSINDGDLATAIPLNDFLNELGVVMQLPKARTTVEKLVAEAQAQAVAAPAGAPAARRRRRVLLPVLALLFAGGLLLVRFTATPAPREIPVALHGEWSTSHAKYRERRLSFSENRVGIRYREGTMPGFHRILSVESDGGQSDSLWYLITYEEDEAPVSFRVQYRSAPRPALVLSNPADVVWERVVADTAGARALP